MKIASIVVIGLLASSAMAKDPIAAIADAAKSKSTVEPWEFIPPNRVISMQTNNKGALVTLQGRCYDKRVQFIAIITDDSGQPTLSVKTKAPRTSDSINKFILMETDTAFINEITAAFQTSAGDIDVVIDTSEYSIQQLYKACF